LCHFGNRAKILVDCYARNEEDSMKRRGTAVVVLLLLFSVSGLYAVTDEEEFRAFSLNLSTPGARAIGMGGAFIGRADDATAAETNPAGLTILARPEVSVEFRHKESRSVRTQIFNIPITNLDGTPTLTSPDPGPDSTVANFSANDTLHSEDNISFAGIVVPVGPVTIAISRHELINSDATLVGSITASPFHFIEPNDFSGNAKIEDVNYGLSAATKIGDVISIGGTVKVADFDIASQVGARQKNQLDFGAHFVSTTRLRDQEVGFNAGILVHPTPKISVGVVYKYEPEFEIGTVRNNVDARPPEVISRVVGFDVPDSLGVGVSVSPASNFTANFDVVRVYYAQLAPVVTDYSLFTHILPTENQANVIEFGIDDQTDYHFGVEYLILHQDFVFALRSGWYRQGRNRFFLNFAANENVRAFLAPIFGSDAGDPFHHLTLGTGLTYGHFQLDFALDLSRKEEIDENLERVVHKSELAEGGVEVIVSTVVRF
jgi:hypothetical protein